MKIVRNLILLFLMLAFHLSPFDGCLCHADPLPPRVVAGGVEFFYENPDAHSVMLAGEFNGWDNAKNPLTKDPATGVWSAVYPLNEGKFDYKFVIDGEWMSGANLTVELKKDSSGKLFVPEPKAGPNTGYSGKIRFGGNVVGTMNHRYFADENRYRLDKPRFHIDLDWDVTVAKEVNAFIRAEMDSSETNQLSLNLFKSHLDFTPEWFDLRIFNNEKNVQFDDPLRLTDKDVAVRYDTLEFSNEPNANRGIGLKSQGMILTAAPRSWFELYGFYLDKSNTDRKINFFSNSEDNLVEDNWGLRAKRSFGEILNVGLSYFVKDGLKWPYADANNYFPDPALFQGHTFSSVVRSSSPAGTPAEFFKGWRDQSTTALDVRFRALPGFWLFGEYAMKSETLRSVRRNDKKGLDLASTTDWKLYDQSHAHFGSQIKIGEKYMLEAFWSGMDTTLGKVLNVEQAKEFSAKTNRYGAKAKLDFKNVVFGAGLSQEKSDSFGNGNLYVDPGVIPTIRQFRFANFSSSSPAGLVEGDLNFQPYVNLDFGDRFKARIFGNFHKYTLRTATATLNAFTLNPEAAPSFILNSYEVIADYLAKIHGPFYLQGSVRFARYSDPDAYAVSGQFWSLYSAVVYRLKKNIMVRLGWGVDPEGFDEDLKEDFDLREQFLYNRYTDAIGTGETISQALVTAERALEAEKRIALRLEIKF